VRMEEKRAGGRLLGRRRSSLGLIRSVLYALARQLGDVQMLSKCQQDANARIGGTL
jgi:hypothetical protein